MRRLRIQKLFDFTLLVCVLILTVCGIFFIYSAGINSTKYGAQTEYTKQILWASMGLVAMIVFALINYNVFYRYSPYIFAGFLLVLVFIFFKGLATHGARSWIGIFGMGIQPLIGYNFGAENFKRMKEELEKIEC